MRLKKILLEAETPNAGEVVVNAKDVAKILSELKSSIIVPGKQISAYSPNTSVYSMVSVINEKLFVENESFFSSLEFFGDKNNQMNLNPTFVKVVTLVYNKIIIGFKKNIEVGLKNPKSPKPSIGVLEKYLTFLEKYISMLSKIKIQ